MQLVLMIKFESSIGSGWNRNQGMVVNFKQVDIELFTKQF